MAKLESAFPEANRRMMSALGIDLTTEEIRPGWTLDTFRERSTMKVYAAFIYHSQEKGRKMFMTVDPDFYESMKEDFIRRYENGEL